MPKLKLALSRRADADHQSIMAFSVKRFGRSVAERYMDGLDQACELLRDFPGRAPFHPTIDPPARMLVHRSHRIFYRVEPDRVLIIRILHHAQDTPSAL